MCGQGEVRAQNRARDSQRLPVSDGVSNEEDQSRDPGVIAELLVDVAHGGIHHAKPADRLKRRPPVWRHGHRIPCPQVAVARQDHLGPPRGGPRQHAASHLKDGQLGLIVDRLTLREGGQPQS